MYHHTGKWELRELLSLNAAAEFESTFLLKTENNQCYYYVYKASTVWGGRIAPTTLSQGRTRAWGCQEEPQAAPNTAGATILTAP